MRHSSAATGYTYLLRTTGPEVGMVEIAVVLSNKEAEAATMFAGPSAASRNKLSLQFPGFSYSEVQSCLATLESMRVVMPCGPGLTIAYSTHSIAL